MSVYNDPASGDKPYRDPTPLPADIPKVQEIGTTSAPLKSAAFFIGAYCKDYNGVFGCIQVYYARESARLGWARWLQHEAFCTRSLRM